MLVLLPMIASESDFRIERALARLMIDTPAQTADRFGGGLIEARFDAG